MGFVLLVSVLFSACEESVLGPDALDEAGKIEFSESEHELDDGQTKRLTIKVYNHQGHVMGTLGSGDGLAWSSSNTNVATVDGSGLTTAEHPGSTEVTASYNDLKASTRVIVRAVAAELVLVAGDGQAAEPGGTLPDSLHVRVVDRHGEGVGGVEVRFSVVGNGGAVSPATVVTGATGDAKTAWTLPQTPGSYSATAEAVGSAVNKVTKASVSFTATARQAGVVAQLVVKPDSVVVAALGDTAAFTAKPLDDAGTAVAGASVVWSSLDAAIVAPVGNGYFVAKANGTTRIVASADGKADTVSVRVSQVPASVKVTPDADTLSIGDTLQLAAVAKDANGFDIAEPSLTWASSNTSIATVDPMGRVVSKATGTVLITAAAFCCAADTSRITAVDTQGGTGGGTSPSVSPWFEEDFSAYTSTSHMLSNPRGVYQSVADVNTSLISLDTSSGYGGLKQSMKYTFPAKSASSADRCSDFAISRSLDLRTWNDGQTVREVWVEVVAKFSANFETVAPSSWGCTSNPDYKFFFGQVFNANGANDNPVQRFSILVGNSLNRNWTFGHPELADEPHPSGASAVWDGQWHRYRFYMRCNTSLNSGNGAYKIWLDDKVLYDFGAIDCDRVIWGFKLGANLNQGPDREMYVWWGRVRVWRTNPGW